MTDPAGTAEPVIMQPGEKLHPVPEQEPDASQEHGGLVGLVVGSIGVVYGDIGTSPLYALRESLARGRERMDAYTLQLQQHGLDGAEREVRWLNELIQNERNDNIRE